MTSLIYIHFVTVVIYVYFFGLLTAQRIYDPVNKALRLFVLTAFGWAFVELLMYFPFAFGNELFLKRLTGLFWAPLTFTFLRFLYVLLKRKKDWMYYAFALGAVVSGSLYLTTDLGVVSCERFNWGVVANNGPYHRYLTILSALAGLYAIFLALKASRNQSFLELKRPLILIVIGMGVSLAAGYAFNLILPTFFGLAHFPRLGFASIIPLFFFVHRSIIRYKFLAVDVEQLGEELFETLHDGVILVDRTGEVRRMNKSAREIFNIDYRTMSGFNVKDLVGQYDPNRTITKKEIETERGGKTRYLTISSSPNIRGGVVVGQLLILRDITAQKAADELLEFRRARLFEEVERQKMELEQARKAERVGTAAGVIAHDFNNILVAIIGYSTIARDELPSENPLRSDYEEILEAGRKARDIVNQILVFSRRGEEQWRLLNIRDELDETLKLLKVSLPANITLKTDFEKDSGYVFAAPTRFHQVVMNICTNAYQAMQDKGGTLTVELKKFTPSQKFLTGHRLLQKGRYAEIRISDTGEGIPQDKVSKIFEPFYTTKEKHEGSGLGLSTALRIATEIGGVITGEGVPSKGSTFAVYLPIWERPADELDSKDKPTKVLIVDEDESIVLLCKRTLEPLGYAVVTHLSPTKALEDLRENPPGFDLVIADENMLEINWSEFESRLLEARSDIPLLMTSSRVSWIAENPSVEGLDLDFLIKPFDQDELKAAVEGILTRQ